CTGVSSPPFTRAAGEKLRNCDGGKRVPTVMPLVYRPTLRCFGQVVNRNGLPCGRRAYFMRDSKFPEDVSYFCDECRQPGDTPIAADAPFRRVTLNVEIHIAGASRIHGAAHAEAVARIEQILEGLGGMVTI